MTDDTGHEWGRLIMGDPDDLSAGRWCRKCGCSEDHAEGKANCAGPKVGPKAKKLFTTRWIADVSA